MSLQIVRFDCHGLDAEPYRCNQPGDMSGDYVQAADAMDVIETLAEALEELADMAERCDSRESFPSAPIDKARDALDNYRRAKA